ncbi:SDR family NAD(P)-dependent oxidoreductase [Micrococcales bacterium 31B]|nr:SDR family NAD(P)-dependent oxidoreductase [Micrococcales bacterium 31B]
MELKDRVALVTGAASGLGRSTADHLAALGARVFGVDLPAGLERAGLQPGAEASGITWVAADITDAASVRAAIARAGEAGPLRAVVHCAGVLATGRIVGRDGTHDFDAFSRTISINLNGSFTVLACAAEAMAASEPLDDDGQRGAVVLTASIAAYEGQVGQIAYSASKAGVVGMVLPAARDLAQHGIRVNAIAPGIVETPMLGEVTPAFKERFEASVPFPARLARPQEYAQCAAALLQYDYINGETLRLDAALRLAPR